MKPILKLTVVACVVGLTATGCTTVKDWLGKRSNGSLDYQSSQKLDPIKLPAAQASGEFVPLYPTPDLGKSQIQLTNDAGKQYQLPKPPRINK